MPQTRITEDNLAPLVDILTWFLLVTSITGVAVRGATKAIILHIIGIDDALITIALHWSVQCGCGTDCEWLWETHYFAYYIGGPHRSKG